MKIITHSLQETEQLGKDLAKKTSAERYSFVIWRFRRR
jgi:hypothetical protein